MEKKEPFYTAGGKVEKSREASLKTKNRATRWSSNLTPELIWRKKKMSLNCVRLFVTLWTVAYQALPSMGFSRQEYWSGLPFPSPGDLPDPGTELGSPKLQADSLPSEPPGKQFWINFSKMLQKYNFLCTQNFFILFTQLSPVSAFYVTINNRM